MSLQSTYTQAVNIADQLGLGSNSTFVGQVFGALLSSDGGGRPATLLDPVADFGVVGDGVTDNADALMAMRQYMADRWDQHFEVHFPQGHYVYSNNLWLNGVGSVLINGNGSKFECITSSDWGGNRRTFFVRHLFDDAPVTEPLEGGGDGAITGCPQARFERATAGSTVLTLKPEIPGQPYLPATGLAAGDRVFLWAFDQQFTGYPPNMRYFEWNEVESVDTGAGTVTLRFPLQFDYEEDLRDDDNWVNVWFGSARLFKLDRPSGYRYARYVELRNLTFHPNRNSPVENNGDISVQIPGDHIVLDRVTAPGWLWLGMNRIAEVRNSHFDNTDIDKLGGNVSVRNCTFDNGFGPASGILDLDIEDCTINGIVSVCARRNRIVGNRISVSSEYGAIRFSSFNSMEQFVAQDNIIFPTTDLNYVINTDVERSFNPDAVDGRNVILDDNDNNRSHIRMLDVGAKLIRGTEAGEITRIWYDQALSQWHIETTFGTLNTIDNLKFYLGQEFIYSNNKVVNQKTWPIRNFTLAFKEGPIDLVVPKDLNYNYPKLYGFISNVEAHVIRPQQNVPSEHPDPVLLVVIRDEADEDVAQFIVDVTQTGVVGTGLAGDVAIGGASAVNTSLPANQFASEVRLLAYKDASSWERVWSGDEADRPIVRLRIEGTSIL